MDPIIDAEVPRDGVPAQKGDLRRNWRGILDAFQGVLRSWPLLGGYREVLARPEIVDGVAEIDLDQANVHTLTLTEDLRELRFSGSLVAGRVTSCTFRLEQTSPARAAPALDALVWVKPKPELPASGRALWISAITIDGGVTWEAFG